MEELCSKVPYDDEDLIDKVRIFLTDRTVDTVTGIRRMGRTNLVSFATEMCQELGIVSSVYPDIDTKGIVFFDHWSVDPKKMEELEASGIDVIYGQDLCHQVPALVRVRKSER